MQAARDAIGLVIELAPKAGSPSSTQLPILNGVEIIREKVLTLGCAMPRFELSSMTPTRSGEIKLLNLRPETFAGIIRLTPKEGFEALPREEGV